MTKAYGIAIATGCFLCLLVNLWVTIIIHGEAVDRMIAIDRKMDVIANAAENISDHITKMESQQ